MKLHHLPTFLVVAYLTALTSRSEPAKAATSYYFPPPGYGMTRDPDLPRYAHRADGIGIEAFKDLDWLDLGVDFRLRSEYRDDDIRRATSGDDEPFLLRTRAFLGIHDRLDPFRFAIELQDSRSLNSHYERDNRDWNEFELIRLQAELFLDDLLPADPRGNDRPVSLRYGIQNFEFLDRRLLGNNQWRNTANTFLGFRGAIGQDANDWSLDLLAVQPIDRQKYQWDEPVDSRWVYGLIGHWRGWSDLVTLEPFYLALSQDQGSGVAERTVHSPGLRAYGSVGTTGFDFDFSAIHQSGDNGPREVNAWGGTAEIGYRFGLPWKPRLSAFYGYASGDKDPSDGNDERFERFYGFGRPWSANDYIVFENIRAPKLRVELTPTDSLRVDFGYSWYQLASATDRFFGANSARDATGSSGSDIGHEFDIRARWQVNKKLESIVGYAHFTAGGFISQVLRPDDSDFAYLEFNYSFF